MEIKIVKAKINITDVKRLAGESFGDMVKAVVDVEQEVLAVGGGMHADAEAVLLEQAGSRQDDLWGINLYPAKPADQMLEFESLINIRPTRGSRAMNIEDEDLRNQIRSIIKKLVNHDS